MSVYCVSVVVHHAQHIGGTQKNTQGQLSFSRHIVGSLIVGSVLLYIQQKTKKTFCSPYPRTVKYINRSTVHTTVTVREQYAQKLSQYGWNQLCNQKKGLKYDTRLAVSLAPKLVSQVWWPRGTTICVPVWNISRTTYIPTIHVLHTELGQSSARVYGVNNSSRLDILCRPSVYMCANDRSCMQSR